HRASPCRARPFRVRTRCGCEAFISTNPRLQKSLHLCDACHSVTQRPSTIVVERVRTIAKEIISMSQVYRAHSPAQAIEEAVVIAAALALLAAVQAAPVPSTTPSRGIFKAEDAVRRKLWTALAVIAFAALAGAAVFGGGGESRDHTLLVNAALSSAAPASAVEPAIAGAA